MAQSISEAVVAHIDTLTELYHRLVLVVAPSGAGKTQALREVAARTGASLINVNHAVSERLLDLTERQRALQLPRVLEEVADRDSPLVLLDNIEILFDVSLAQDPLRLLQQQSRNRTVVASWNGNLVSGYLTYAVPGHPEYRRYPARDLVVVCPKVAA